MDLREIEEVVDSIWSGGLVDVEISIKQKRFSNLEGRGEKGREEGSVVGSSSPLTSRRPSCRTAVRAFAPK